MAASWSSPRSWYGISSSLRSKSFHELASNAVAGIDGRPLDGLLGQVGANVTAMRPYAGQSGKLTGVTAPMDRDGFFAVPGGGTNAVPEKYVIAELEGVGCFQASTSGPEGRFPLGYDRGDISIAKYRQWARDSLPGTMIEGSSAWSAHLRNYVTKREVVLTTAYSAFGLAGLELLRAEYASPEHAQALELLRAETKDPAYLAGLAPLERAKLEALLRNPARFLPCGAVRNGA